MTFKESQQMLNQVLLALDTVSIKGRQNIRTMDGCMSVIESIVTAEDDTEETANTK